MFQVVEAHHHVGYLHAGVVDVVLHLHAMAARAQHAHESVAQGGVAQMADMRGLVGVDVGVLDDDLLARALRPGGFAAQQTRRVRAAVQADVDVPVAGHFHGRDAGNGADFLDQLRGNFPRRLAKLFGELEGRGHGHFAEVALPRLLDGHREIDAVTDLYVRVESAGNLLFDGMEHGNPEYNKGGVPPPSRIACAGLPSCAGLP